MEPLQLLQSAVCKQWCGVAALCCAGEGREPGDVIDQLQVVLSLSPASFISGSISSTDTANEPSASRGVGNATSLTRAAVDQSAGPRVAGISHHYGCLAQDKTCLGSPLQELCVAAALGGTSLHQDLARASLLPPVCLMQTRRSCPYFLTISLLCSAQYLAFFSFSPRFSLGFLRDVQ